MSDNRKLPYNPKDNEPIIYRFWEQNELFKAPSVPTKKYFSMVMPPPNITGTLHIGHALNATIGGVMRSHQRRSGTDLQNVVPGGNLQRVNGHGPAALGYGTENNIVAVGEAASLVNFFYYLAIHSMRQPPLALRLRHSHRSPASLSEVRT